MVLLVFQTTDCNCLALFIWYTLNIFWWGYTLYTISRKCTRGCALVFCWLPISCECMGAFRTQFWLSFWWNVTVTFNKSWRIFGKTFGDIEFSFAFCLFLSNYLFIKLFCLLFHLKYYFPYNKFSSRKSAVNFGTIPLIFNCLFLHGCLILILDWL